MLIVGAALGIAGWHLYPAWKTYLTESAPVPAVASITDPDKGNEDITALGRLEPRDGVMKISGPSRGSVVISDLRIHEGDQVQQGQVIAVLDNYISNEATVTRLKAELENTEAEFKRQQSLFERGIASVSARDDLSTRVTVGKAQLKQAQAELEQAVVRSPITGQILKINAYPGERVGPDGIAELGRTAEMYAVAEVYETDIGKVHTGQRAFVTSPALGEPAHGTVEHIGLKIGKRDVLNTDPAADTDARVVEVHIRLDDSARVAALTNLQVEVFIKQ